MQQDCLIISDELYTLFTVYTFKQLCKLCNFMHFWAANNIFLVKENMTYRDTVGWTKQIVVRHHQNE